VIRAAALPAALGLTMLAAGARAEPASARVPADAVLADEVVAVVDARAVLLSELELETRLAEGRRTGAAGLLTAPSPEALGAALDRLVDEYVLHAEADRLQVFELSDAEVAAGIAQLRRAVGAEALSKLMDRFGVAEATLEAIVRRELRVRRYLEGRFRLAARPREADVQAAARRAAGGPPDAEALQTARERLGREKYEQLTRDFTADVRRRARVRVLHDPASAGSATPLSGSVTAPDAAAADRAARGPRGGGG